MSHIIIKLVDSTSISWYLAWSSITDSPVTPGLTRAQLILWWIDEHGEAPKQAVLDRLERSGTSCARVIRGNRAGVGDTELTEAQIIEEWCTGSWNCPWADCNGVSRKSDLDCGICGRVNERILIEQLGTVLFMPLPLSAATAAAARAALCQRWLRWRADLQRPIGETEHGECVPVPSAVASAPPVALAQQQLESGAWRPDDRIPDLKMKPLRCGICRASSAKGGKRGWRIVTTPGTDTLDGVLCGACDTPANERRVIARIVGPANKPGDLP